MPRLPRLVLLALVAPLFAAAPLLAETPATRPAATQPAAGGLGLFGPVSKSQTRIERRTYDLKDAGDAGKGMEYALFVPTTYDKAKPTPLVVALHGLYSNPQQIVRYPGLTDLAEKHGFIVVAPMGFNNHGWYGATPLVRGRDDDPKNLPELSERDVMSVLEIARKEFNVDPDRTYLLGHSMGGGGTWHLAIKNPDLFAAIAPIAPATLRPATDLEKIKHVPVMLVQGDKDALVKVDRVRPWAAEMKRLGMTHEYLEVAGGGHVDVAFSSLPKIFDFFAAHRRGEAKKPAAKE